MICIYKILNKETKKFYIGRTIDFKRRVYSHRHRMKKGIHGNSCLNKACAKYGLDVFEFIVLEECDEEVLIDREQWYIDNICIPNWGSCYNMSKSSTDGGNLLSEECRKSLSRRNSNNTGDKNPNWRGGKTFCKCGARISSYSKTCQKCQDKSGENNPFYGKKHSEETKKKLSEISKGKFNGVQSKPVIIESVEYPSVSQAAREFSVDPKTIINRIRSKNPKFKNYLYK